MEVQFWERTNKLIKEKGFTQETLSLQCEFNERRINNLSGGPRYPRAQELVRMARELDTTVEYLFTGEEESGLTKEERALLTGFQQLNAEAQKEVLSYVNWQVDQANEEAGQDVPAANQSRQGRKKGA
jgi:transcriptional regulator with XRE-family HTH domain